MTDKAFMEDFRNVEAMVSTMRKHSLSVRQLELLLTIRIPRMPEEIESRINMDRMTLKKIWKKRPDLINKVTVEETPKRRGKSPTLYGLTNIGIGVLRELKGKADEKEA